jgi:hypothetical protein
MRGSADEIPVRAAELPMSDTVIGSCPTRFRTGYLALLLPASTPVDEVPTLIRELVIAALAASGEWPIRVEIVTRQRVTNNAMQRWFVEYDTGRADGPPS